MKRRIFFIITCAVMSAFMLTFSFASYSTKISPAFDILEKELTMIMTSSSSEGIFFDETDFEDAVGTSEIDSITINSLPSPASGVLFLGNVEVMKNQTVSSSNLNMLRFVPLSDTAETSFSYTANLKSGSRSLTCSLYVINGENASPVTTYTGRVYTDVTTYSGIPYYGTMKVSDPENDQLTYQIVSKPKNGKLELTDKSAGSYIYTPLDNYSGQDSFVYNAFDKYGNTSENVSVSITVKANTAGHTYDDMEGSWAYSCALRATEMGLMSGKYEGTKYVFSPDSDVTRAEFLALAMKAAGYQTDNISVINTGFEDDDLIPAEYKSCVALASELNIINGVPAEEGVFLYPTSSITRAEAAVILNNMLDIEETVFRPVFRDETHIPSWAESAIYTMNNAGILCGVGEGYISPYSTVSRAQTAQILCILMDINK